MCVVPSPSVRLCFLLLLFFILAQALCFDKIKFINFFFTCYAFGVKSKKSLLSPKSQVSPRNFKVLSFTFTIYDSFKVYFYIKCEVCNKLH